MAAGTVRTFVVTPNTDKTVVAYYAWRMGHITRKEAPSRWRAGVGRYPQPVAILARLAVHSDHTGRGLGAGLLVDVLSRFVDVADEIGVRGLLIHCEDETARDFYQHLLPGLTPLVSDGDVINELTQVVLAKDLRKTLRALHRA